MSCALYTPMNASKHSGETGTVAAATAAVAVAAVTEQQQPLLLPRKRTDDVVLQMLFARGNICYCSGGSRSTAAVAGR